MWCAKAVLGLNASSAAHYDDLKVMDGILQVRAALAADGAEVVVVAVDVVHTKRLRTDAAAGHVAGAAAGAQAVGRGWWGHGHGREG